MAFKKRAGAPAFNPAEPHGTLYGSGDESDMAGVRYVQRGHYYAANQEYVGSDESASTVAVSAAPVREVNRNERFVEPEEATELLKDPRAAKLMSSSLDELAAITKEHGGPQFGGDNALALYTAWLLKFAVE
jgi:hypothetical protein